MKHLALSVTLTLPTFAFADVNLTKVGVGVDCSTGRYGGPTATRICAVPVSVDMFRGSYELKLTAPYVDSRSSGQLAKGMGDTTLYVAKTFEEPGQGLDEANFGLRVKFANARTDKGLGNGQVGYQFEAGIVKSWGPRLLIAYVGVSTGGMSPGHSMAPYTTLWFKSELSPTWTLGWIYENYNLANASRAVADIVFIPEYKMTPKVTLKPMIYKGLTRSTPSVGIGLLATYAID